MKNYLNEVNQLFPIRKNKSQKQEFFNYVVDEFGSDKVTKQTIDKNDNIIIGDLQNAKVIFTAHYDTPASSIVPNLMMPRNKLLATLYGLSVFIILAILSLAIAYGVAGLVGIPQPYTMLLYLLIYFTSAFLSVKCFTNKNNANDNTSGVVTVLTIASKVASSKVAYVLFDNEEKGLLGSKAFNKKHKDMLADKLIVNFDCVANGNEILFVTKDGAERHQLFEKFKQSFVSENNFNVYFFPFKTSAGNSDHKSFENSIGVMACTKGKIIKFYTSKIHTKKDVVARTENVEFLQKHALDFIEKI